MAQASLNGAEFERLASRRLADPQRRDVRSTDGVVALTLLATAQPSITKLGNTTEDSPAQYGIEVTFGETDLLCIVWTGRLAAAALFWNLAQGAALDAAYEAEFHDLAAGATAGRPWLLAQVLYKVKRTDGYTIHSEHIAAGAVDGASLGCTLRGPGYGGAFADSFRRALASLDTPSIRQAANPAPQLHEIQHVRSTEATGPSAVSVGFDELTIAAGEDGEERASRLTSTLTRTSAGELVALDTIATELARDGAVLRRSAVQLRDGEPTYVLALTQSDSDNRYQVSGTWLHEPIDGTLDAPRPLPSQASAIASLARFMSEERRSSYSLPEWLPDVDPLSIQQLTVSPLDDPDSEYNARVTGGPAPVHLQVNPDGHILAARLSQGTTPSTQHRIWPPADP